MSVLPIVLSQNDFDAIVKAMEQTLDDLEFYGLDDFEDTTNEAIERLKNAIQVARGYR